MVQDADIDAMEDW